MTERQLTPTSLSFCFYDSAGKEVYCSENIDKWAKEALFILHKVRDDNVSFMIDIKDICDTGEQCGCFLRGNPVRYIPTCSNRLISAEGSMILYGDKNLILKKRPEEGKHGDYIKIGKIDICKEDDKRYKITPMREGGILMDCQTEDQTVEMMIYLIKNFRGFVAYEFEAEVHIKDWNDYSDVLSGMIDIEGFPILQLTGGSLFNFPFDFFSMNPRFNIHVVLEDKYVWHILDYCSVDSKIVDGIQKSKVFVRVLANNNPLIAH